MSATLPSTGDANWQNLVDNWTEGDAEFLQERLVQRVTSASDFTLNSLVGTTPGAGTVASINAGRAFYNTTTKNVVVSTTGANAGLKALLASSSIKLVDTGANAEILLTGGGAGTGISFAATGITIGGPVTFTGAVTAPAFSASGLTSTGFLSVRAGNAAGLLVTDATSAKLNTTALSDASAGVRIATATGNVLTLNNPSGGNASLTIGGALTAGSLVSTSTISGTSISASSAAIAALTGTSVTATGTVQGATVTSTGAVNGATAAISGTGTLGGLTVSGNGTVSGTLDVTGLASFGTIPVGPASDPTTANQLSRKSYVDNRNVGMTVAGTSITGGAINLALPVRVIAGTSTPTTDSAGVGQVVFPGGGFANRLISVVAWSGDAGVCDGPVTRSSGDGGSFSFRAKKTTVVSPFGYPGLEAHVGIIRIDYIAFGQ